MYKKRTLLIITINAIIQLLLFYVITSIIMDNNNNAFILSIILTLMFSGIQFFTANSILLKVLHAHPCNEIEFETILERLETIATKFNINVPKLYMIDDENINSISVGKHPNFSYICLTQGCFKKLNQTEIEYLLLYEINKLLNRETAFCTVTIPTVGFAIVLADMFFRSIHRAIKKRGQPSESVMRLTLTGYFNSISPMLMNLVHICIPKYYDIQNDNLTNSQVGTNEIIISILNKAKHNKPDEDYSLACSNMFFTNPLVKQEIFEKINHHMDINNRIEYAKNN